MGSSNLANEAPTMRRLTTTTALFALLLAACGGAGDSADSAMPLRDIFSGDCANDGPTAYSAGIGDASQWSHVVPLGAMVGTHVTPVD
ncbi:MAG: hypothetical protein EBS71_09465, partial [Actinobacteria bacterium]|nr:hypothetical protein [Actinomycetota bacterium]